MKFSTALTLRLLLLLLWVGTPHGAVAAEIQWNDPRLHAWTEILTEFRGQSKAPYRFDHNLSETTQKHLEQRALTWIKQNQNEPALLEMAMGGWSALYFRPQIMQAMSENPLLQNRLVNQINDLLKNNLRIKPQKEWVQPLVRALKGATPATMQLFFEEQFYYSGSRSSWFALGDQWKDVLLSALNSSALSPELIARYYAASSPEQQNVLARILFPALDEVRLLALSGEPKIANRLIQEKSAAILTPRWIETWLISSPDTRKDLLKTLQSGSFPRALLEDLSLRYSKNPTSDPALLLDWIRPQVPTSQQERTHLKKHILTRGRPEMLRYLLCPETFEWSAREVLSDIQWIEDLDLIEYVVRNERVPLSLRRNIINQSLLTQPHWKQHPELFLNPTKPMDASELHKQFTGGKTFSDRNSCLSSILHSLHGGTLR